MFLCASKFDAEEQQASLLKEFFSRNEIEAEKEEREDPDNPIALDPISDTDEQVGDHEEDENEDEDEDEDGICEQEDEVEQEGDNEIPLPQSETQRRKRIRRDDDYEYY